MTDERDEMLDELRAVMNIEPSPEFEARVRLATQESHSRDGVWIGRRRTWMWGAAGGAVAAAAIVAVLLRPVGVPSTVATRQLQLAAVSTTPARSIQPSAIAGDRPTSSHGVARGATRAMPAARVTRREPEVLVPSDQAIALARLLAGVSDGRVMIGATRAIEEDVTIAPLSDPTPVTITEVRIDSLPVPTGGAS